jgi:hypothetical protein
MIRSHNLAPPGRQRGWAGILVMLVGLVIVAVLAKDALKGYGLLPGAASTPKAGTPAERARSPGGIAGEAFDPGAAPAAPASALERARGVEDMVKQQAAERAARPDGTTR